MKCKGMEEGLGGAGEPPGKGWEHGDSAGGDSGVHLAL